MLVIKTCRLILYGDHLDGVRAVVHRLSWKVEDVPSDVTAIWTGSRRSWNKHISASSTDTGCLKSLDSEHVLGEEAA